MPVQIRDFSIEQLARFKTLQQQVYAVLDEVSQSLKAGETEREVAKRIHRVLKPIGLQSYFHVPVALFGERTAYPGEFGQFEALPTGRKLRDEDAVILDCAPIIDGYTIDCSYAVPRGDLAANAQADALLKRCRDHILMRAKARANMREVAREIDAMITVAGMLNCHKKHIGNVLGHRITYCDKSWWVKRRLWGLSLPPVGYFVSSSIRSRRGKPELTPNWNAGRQSDTPVQPGIWAIEPHVALGATGAKFEEMLVATGDDAYYLDDSLPHSVRWAKGAAAPVA